MSDVYTPEGEAALRNAIAAGLRRDPDGYLSAMQHVPLGTGLSAAGGSVILAERGDSPDPALNIPVAQYASLARAEQQWLGIDLGATYDGLIQAGATNEKSVRDLLAEATEQQVLCAAGLIVVSNLRHLPSEAAQEARIEQLLAPLRAQAGVATPAAAPSSSMTDHAGTASGGGSMPDYTLAGESALRFAYAAGLLGERDRFALGISAQQGTMLPLAVLRASMMACLEGRKPEVADMEMFAAWAQPETEWFGQNPGVLLFGAAAAAMGFTIDALKDVSPEVLNTLAALLVIGILRKFPDDAARAHVLDKVFQSVRAALI